MMTDPSGLDSNRLAGWPEQLFPPGCLPELDAMMHELGQYFDQDRYLEKWPRESERFLDIEGLLAWPALHVEAGCGRGLQLLESARNQPLCFHLGIERNHSRFQTARERIGRSGLHNIMVVKRDIIPLVAFNFPGGSVQQYDFYYPDPWPRHRHRRRRWHRHPFMREIDRSLRPGGTLRFTSDQAFYLREAAWLLFHRFGYSILELGPVPAGRSRTHFEIKYLAQGRLLWEGVFQKPE